MKEVQLSSSDNTVRYNDLAMRFVLSMIAAHIMTSYNEPDGFFELILTASYLRGFIASLIISFLIVNYIYTITIRLDKKRNWIQHTFLRFIWQVLLGFAVPALVVVLLVAVFLKYYDINILNTEYLSQDYPLVLLMLLIVNLYYFGLYHFLILTKPKIIQQTKSEESELQTLADPDPEEKNDIAVYKETIIIHTPLKTFPVQIDDIAYIFRLNDGVFIRLKSMENLNESYQTNYSLKDLESFLDPSKFFRINRQMIVSFQVVSAFRPETAKTLLLTLNPEMYPVKKDMPYEHQKLTVVSETKTPRFKLWMNR